MPNNCFPYPGNKARHAEWVIEHLPEHTCYVEPFGGAAGVLFNKPRSKVEIYNDIDGDIVQFFEVLREHTEELQTWLRRVPYSRELHEKWAAAYYDGHRPDDDIERAGRWYYLRYSQFGSKTVAKDAFATGVAPGGANTGRFANSVDGLADLAERLRRVVIESEDWHNIIDRYDAPQTVFYCDPPYEGTEHRYTSGDFDHRRLYETLTSCEAKAVVSYDSVPPWYGDGWTVDTKDSYFQIGQQSDGGWKDCEEVLLMNFDSSGEPLMSGVGQQDLAEYAD